MSQHMKANRPQQKDWSFVFNAPFKPAPPLQYVPEPTEQAVTCCDCHVKELQGRDAPEFICGCKCHKM